MSELLNFPPLGEEDIEVRAGEVSWKGVELVLYKNAVIDSMMLDEKFGPLNWKKENTVILRPDGSEKLTCTISVYNDKIGEWISKDGVGTETDLFSEKGQETDAFKRAGFVWGIGRELKNKAPRLYFPEAQCNIQKIGKDSEGNDICACFDRFVVSQIRYDNPDTINRRIAAICIDNKSTGGRLIWDIRDSLEAERAKRESSAKTAKPEPAVITSKKAAVKEQEATTDKKVAEKPLPSPTSSSPEEMLVTLGNFGKKETKLKELLPAQLCWVFNHKDADAELKKAVLLMAQKSEEIKSEFVRKGIAINAELANIA